MTVAIVLKQGQRTGKQTTGIVKDLLTKSPNHPHGIKVRLTDGQVGRVQKILTRIDTYIMYIAKRLEEFEPQPTGWKYCKVGVFLVDGDLEEQVGEYQRNYGTLFDSFFHFQMNGKDLALYSSDYTATRIMELPSCKDLGGEEPADMGFCPVDYFVPTYIDEEVVNETNNEAFPPRTVSVRRVNNPSKERLFPSSRKRSYVNGVTGEECEDTIATRPITPLIYYPFGFVSGCIWADESSWKVQYLDLSRAEEGILVREERFGYIELPEGVRLKDAIDMSVYGYDLGESIVTNIRINSVQTFDLENGKVIDPTG